MQIPSGQICLLGKDYVSCLSISDRHAPRGGGIRHLRYFVAVAAMQYAIPLLIFAFTLSCHMQSNDEAFRMPRQNANWIFSRDRWSGSSTHRGE